MVLDAVGNPRRFCCSAAPRRSGWRSASAICATPAVIILADLPNAPKREAAIAQTEGRGGAKSVEYLDFDALDTANHPGGHRRGLAGGDVDVAIVAFGILGDAEELWQNQAKAVTIAQINYTAAVSVGVLVGEKMRPGLRADHRDVVGGRRAGPPLQLRLRLHQGRTGRLLPRPRGSVAGFGVHVLVIRPGQVRTTTTLGTGGHRRQEAPFTVDRRRRRAAVTSAAKGKDLVWAPGQVPVLMIGAAAHPAAHLPQAADLHAYRPGHRRGLAVAAVRWPAASPSSR